MRVVLYGQQTPFAAEPERHRWAIGTNDGDESAADDAAAGDKREESRTAGVIDHVGEETRGKTQQAHGGQSKQRRRRARVAPPHGNREERWRWQARQSPRGGSPVAAKVAPALDAPLDLLIVCKIGVLSQPELAMGVFASLCCQEPRDLLDLFGSEVL